MKKYLLLIIISCFTTTLFAQTGTLSGQVTDHNQKPVVAATVTIKELNKSTMTNQDGRYEISGLKYGSYTVSISSITTHAKTITIKVSSAKTVANAEVKGDKDRELQQVNVQGKTEKRKIETSGFAVNVIDTKDASLRNLQTNELLNRTVGVRVRQSGGIGAASSYNLNGMSGRAIGIFIDGIDISTYGPSFNLNNIPPAMIERVEVYKGVLPAHLAGDYLGGGINVILKKGGVATNFVASASYGSFNTYQADVGGTYRNPNSGFTFRGSGFYTYSDNNYEVWGKFVRNEQPDGQMKETRGRRFNDAYKSFGGRVEAGFTGVKWADNFMVNYNISDVYDEVQHGQYMSRPYKDRFTESKSHVVGLDYKKNDLFIKGLNLLFNGVHSDRDQYIQDTVTYRYNWDGQRVIGIKGVPIRSTTGAQQGAATMATIDQKITSLRASLSYNIAENHKVVYNHMYYLVDRRDFDPLRDIVQQSFEANSNLTKNVSALSYEAKFFNGKLTTNLFGKNYNQKIDRIEPVLQTVNGQPTRVERNTKDSRSATGYGFATSYELVPSFVLIGSAEKAVRMPDEGAIFGNQTQNLLPNLFILPEFSNNYNLGFRAGSYKLNEHNRVSFSGAVFVRDTKDKIVQQSSDRSVTNMETSTLVNLPGVRTIGFEAEVNYIYRKLNVILNTSRLHAPLNNPGVRGHDRQIPNEPFFTGNANVQYRLNDVFKKNSIMNLYYNLGYVHSFETIFQDKVDPYNTTPTQFIQDIGVTYRFPNQRVVVSFDAKNILNAEAYDNFAVQKPGRAFYIKLNYTINNF